MPLSCGVSVGMVVIVEEVVVIGKDVVACDDVVFELPVFVDDVVAVGDVVIA